MKYTPNSKKKKVNNIDERNFAKVTGENRNKKHEGKKLQRCRLGCFFQSTQNI